MMRTHGPRMLMINMGLIGIPDNHNFITFIHKRQPIKIRFWKNDNNSKWQWATLGACGEDGTRETAIASARDFICNKQLKQLTID